jgi:hypothetical protein
MEKACPAPDSGLWNVFFEIFSRNKVFDAIKKLPGSTAFFKVKKSVRFLVKFNQKKNCDCHENSYRPGIVYEICNWVVHTFVKLLFLLCKSVKCQDNKKQKRENYSQIVIG